jgi:hypothetical protein
LAQIVTSLGARDLAIVATVSKLRLVTSLQLQRLHFTSGTPASNARQARRAFQRLTDLRVLTRLERRIGGVRAGSAGHIYRLDVAGQHIAQTTQGRRRRPGEPGLPFVKHTLAIAELYVRLVEADRANKIELIEFDAEPGCWRPFFGPGGARLRLKPDAFVRTGRGEFEDLWFVEVDCATHGGTALATKFRTYRQYWATEREQAKWGGVFPKVLWLVPSVPRLCQLLDVAAAQPPESWQLFTVRLFDEALLVMAGEAS